MIKEKDKQPGEEIHRVKSEGVPSTGDAVPMELGCVALPVWMHVSTSWEAL